MTQAIVVTSGGMDSTTALYLANHAWDNEIAAISFDYGQRHKVELDYAQASCERLGIPWQRVDLTSITKLLGGSALTDDVDVPDGHYAEENMSVTVVPNRNAIMANIAAAYAISQKSKALVLGMHAGDHAVYPDCRPEFVYVLSQLLGVANEGFIDPEFVVWTPFIKIDKAQIAEIGEGYGVPWHMTWSCYKGGKKHCGRCATCVERLEAFHKAEVTDKTEYEDSEYYKEVCDL